MKTKKNKHIPFIYPSPSSEANSMTHFTNFTTQPQKKNAIDTCLHQVSLIFYLFI